MRAAILYGPEDVRLESVPIPPVGPGEVRIRIRAALTCGTDVKVYRRGYHARMLTPPCRFGHEMAGEIDAVGEGVTEWKPGDRVVAANSAPCGGCFFCLRERPELCDDLLFLNGAYSQFITVPERIVRVNLLSIPDHLGFDSAALVEPLACVIHGLDRTPVREGQTAVVIGPGAIGLMFVRLCSLTGARVICVGRGRNRLETARMLGAAATISSLDEPDVVGAVRKLAYDGLGPDRVFECMGSRETWQQAAAMVQNGGTVNLFGGCPAGTTAVFDTGRIHYDSITLQGTFHHTPNTIERARNFLASGLKLDSLISASAPLDALPDVLRELASGSDKIKVAIHPN